jgi:SnoaL-like domain
MIKKVLTSIVTLVFVALLGYRVAAARSDRRTQAEDRVQIEKLMWRYDRALEGRNPDPYVALYTPNGQFGNGVNAFKGREAIKKMFMDLKQREAKGQPGRVIVMNLSSYLEFPDRDHAHMAGYWLEVSPRTGPNAPASIVGAGRDVDDFERVSGQWFIKLRDVAPSD